VTSIFAIIEVPVLGVSLDVVLPSHLTVSQAIGLLIRMMSSTNKGELESNGVILCDVDNGRILSMADSIGSLSDACRLALV